MKKIPLLTSLLFFLIFLLIYFPWLLHFELIGGDWPYFFQEGINNFSFMPPAWSPIHGNGLGGTLITYALDSYLYFTGWFFSHMLHIPWPFVYKFLFFGMFLFLSIFSVWYLLKQLFPQIPLVYRLLGIFLYAANTYILLIVSGGQMGIALAYSMAPLVLASLIKITNYELRITNYQRLEIRNQRLIIKYLIIAGLVFSVQVMFDFRIAYITFAATILYFVLSIKYKVLKENIRTSCFLLLTSLVIPIGITVLLHAFWLLPLLLGGQNPIEQVGDIYTTAGAVKFFSFAQLENSFSLLHPNWPENLFGKTYFMRWEFLILPLLAFSSLLFVSNKSQNHTEPYAKLRRNVLFFALLGLSGAFLAKGSNEPFGGIYLWLFDNIPGFIMFRDPTKFYLLIALPYSVLIPFAVWNIYEWLKTKNKFSILNFKFSIKSKILNFQNVFFLLLMSYFLYLIHPALLGQLGGTFKLQDVPVEYVALKDKLVNNKDFFRTLWIPRQQRFTFASNTHPSVEADPLFSASDSASLVKFFKSPQAENYLSDLGIRYMIIPYDPYGEIFVVDRKYSQKKRDNYENVLDRVSWLKKVQDGKIAIYETRKHKDRFWLENRKGKLSYIMKSPTKFEVDLKDVKKGDAIIFSENYSKYWRADLHNENQDLINSPFKTGNTKLNSFILSKDGDYTISVYYSDEIYYLLGRYISLIALVILLIVLFRREDR